MLDPDLLDIKQLKEMKLWPTPTMSSTGLIPYIKRMKKEVEILSLGVLRGETEVDILDNCSNVKMIECYTGDKFNQELFDTNTKTQKDRLVIRDPSSETTKKYDIVIIDGKINTAANLKNAYDLVKVGGYLAGNEYDTLPVKQSIKEFKTTCRVGTPPNITLNYGWFIIKF